MAAKKNTLTENLFEAFAKSLGDSIEPVQKKAIEELATDIADSIVKFIQDQTFNITEMKAITEIEKFQTSGPYKADILPKVKVKTGTRMKSQVNGGMTGAPGPVANATGLGETITKGILEQTKEGILIPKVNFKKKKGQGGQLRSKGYSYIGKNPVGSSPPRRSKVKLVKVTNK